MINNGKQAVMTYSEIQIKMHDETGMYRVIKSTQLVLQLRKKDIIYKQKQPPG
jgi:hypothetical protein